MALGRTRVFLEHFSVARGYHPKVARSVRTDIRHIKIYTVMQYEGYLWPVVSNRKAAMEEIAFGIIMLVQVK